ncbi:MAG: hypothetical protein ACJ77M_01600 [Thermoleophilaceae bacterium]|jgi:hypothetical protein
MAEREEIRSGARELLSPGNVNERLEEAIAERPQARRLIDLRIVARAVFVAAALTIICLILFSPLFAGVVLLLSFFGSWILLSRLSYERRRPTQSSDDDGDGADSSESDGD